VATVTIIRDFGLPPRYKRHLCSSGMLSIFDYAAYLLEERRSQR